MADDGLIAGTRRKLQRPGVLPSVTVLEIVERRLPMASCWPARSPGPSESGPPPRILVAPRASRTRARPPASATASWPGSRRRGLDDTRYQARAHQAAAPRHAKPARHLPRAIPTAAASSIRSTASSAKNVRWSRAMRRRTPRTANWSASSSPAPRGFRRGKRRVERLGNPQDSAPTSLIAIHAHGIPTPFPQAVLSEAEAAGHARSAGPRTDLRAIPLRHHRSGRTRATMTTRCGRSPMTIPPTKAAMSSWSPSPTSPIT